MGRPTSKDVYTTILLVLFLFVALVLLRYIRSKEGFANPEPQPELYDLSLFFKPYPLEEICPIYTPLFDTLVKGESTDKQGKPIPNDIALENANKRLNSEVPTGPFPCPFVFPKKNDLDTAVTFVEGLDKRILSKAKATMLFCVVSLQQTVDGAKKGMASIPKKTEEGFLTECSPEEISLQATVPLQCIPADKMKATEKEEIDKEDKTVQIQKVAKKQTIAKTLGQIASDFKIYDESYKREVNKAIEQMTKDYQKAELDAQKAKKTAEDSEDETIIKAAQNAAELAGEKKGMLERFGQYQKIMNLSISELITKAKALDAEAKAIQNKFKSGQITL